MRMIFAPTVPAGACGLTGAVTCSNVKLPASDWPRMVIVRFAETFSELPAMPPAVFGGRVDRDAGGGR